MANIAILLADEYEDSELTVPFAKLRDAGHMMTVVGARRGETLTGKRGNAEAVVDATPGELDPAVYDAVLIPGGHSPDKLRLNPQMVDFVRGFATTERPLAAVCHGPQLLIEADLVKGRRLTSWPSVRKDLENAGADWVDEEVVVDGNLITSRKPDDLEAFSNALLEQLRERASSGVLA